MKKVACIGNITYDVLGYTYGYPIENERWNTNKLICCPGGPANNASEVVKKYTGNVDLYGIIGNDVFSNIILDNLQRRGINIKHIEQPKEMETPFSYIIVSENNKTRTINTYRNDFNNRLFSFKNYGNDYDIILTDGKYPKATLELMKNNPTAITIIDAGRFNKDIDNLCKEIDYVICSEDYANLVASDSGINKKIDINNTKDTFEVLNALNKRYNKSLVVATVGEHGYIFTNNNNVINVPAQKYGKVIDTTAAGDIFHGAFAAALANNLDIYESLQFANHISSMAVCREGTLTSIPEYEEIKDLYNNKEKILSKKK